jgi:hypothetical protein
VLFANGLQFQLLFLSLVRFASKVSLQACASWLKQPNNSPEAMLLVLKLLDTLPLTSNLVIMTGIGTTILKMKKTGELFVDLWP